MINKNVAAKLRLKREKLNMTQLELSKKLGLDTMQFVSLYERGLSKVPHKTLGQLFVIFNMSTKEQKQYVDLLAHDFRCEMIDKIFEGMKI
ncbi:MAG: helix-turn-helix transcriptional regulator [Ignavibacteria bacterium]|nr:helix-turn-helix transcriptional regulator [Ignavibacteria bacterium]